MSDSLLSSQIQFLSSSVAQLESTSTDLRSQQKQLEDAGEYVQAEHCRTEFLRLKDLLRTEKLRLVTSEQIQQKLELETSQLDDFEEFKRMWGQRMKQKDDKDRELIEDAKRRSEEDLELLRSRLEAKLPLRPKPSATMLSLRETEKRAAKAKHYQDAQFCKTKAQELEQFELENWLQTRQEKISHELTQRAKKHQLDLNSLQQRLEAERYELERIRGFETEALMKKYQNSKAELEVMQGINKNKMEGKHTTVAGRYSTSSQVITRIMNSSKSPAPWTRQRNSMSRSTPQARAEL